MAIVLEVAGTTSLKLSQGFTLIYPSIFAVLLYGGAISLIPRVLKRMEMSVAYGIWAGLGAVFVASIGFFWLHETVTLLKLIGIGLVIIGAVGLNLANTDPQKQRSKSFSVEKRFQ
jgi:small multidrug resistance pump